MKNFLSKEGLEKLKKELEFLQNDKRKEMAARLKHAISFGDLKENFAYHEAKEQQGFLEGRIQELKHLINTSQIIEKNESGLVQIGSEVTLKSKDSTDKYSIVSPPEADPFKNKISSESPLGKLLMGKKKGDKFDFPLPDGVIKYTIDKID